MRRHQERVTDGEDRRTINHHAIEEPTGFGDELTKSRATQNFRRIRRASAARENEQLATSCSEQSAADRQIVSHGVDLLCRDRARGRNEIGFADQAINNAGHVGGIIVARLEAKDFVHARPAQVAVDQEDAMTLLGEGERIVGARKTLAFIRHGAREERNFSLRFGAKKGKGRAQITARFRGGTFRRFGNNALTAHGCALAFLGVFPLL
jgi:hypothetical protein